MRWEGARKETERQGWVGAGLGGERKERSRDRRKRGARRTVVEVEGGAGSAGS